jgi:hypothetical protein
LTLSDYGNIASIAGFILTIFILLNVRSLRKQYTFKARVPELTRKLNSHASKLADYHQNFEDSREEIILELANSEAVLKSLGEKVNKSTRGSIKILLAQIKEYNLYKANNNADFLWNRIYVLMRKLVTELGELQQDLKWEK